MPPAKDVQKLRQATGAGMMDAKRALEQADGDFETAREILRRKSRGATEERSHRAQGEGTIGCYLHNQLGRPVLGVLVELSCETDFVAKSDDFQQAANNLAMHVAAVNPRWIRRDDAPANFVANEKEVFAEQARNAGKSDAVIPAVVEGRLRAFFEESVLYEQRFVNPERFDGTVAEMVEELTEKFGENIGVRRFCRFGVGG